MADVSIQLWMTCCMIIMVGLCAAGIIGYNRKKKRDQDNDK